MANGCPQVSMRAKGRVARAHSSLSNGASSKLIQMEGLQVEIGWQQQLGQER